MASALLDEWFSSFMRRFPPPEGLHRPLDPESIVDAALGFRRAGDEHFEAMLRIHPEFYVVIMMTETNVLAAICRGEHADVIRDWCTRTLAAVFRGEARDVIFTGYVVHLVST